MRCVKMSKKILVVGGGGREHAIIKALKKSPDCGEVWCAPGNGGIGYDAHCVNIKATDVETMVGFAETEKFDYVVVAQDDPLALGMVDALAAGRHPGFRPGQGRCPHRGIQGLFERPHEEVRHPHRKV